jgi:hypothetical protein
MSRPKCPSNLYRDSYRNLCGNQYLNRSIGFWGGGWPPLSFGTRVGAQVASLRCPLLRPSVFTVGPTWQRTSPLPPDTLQVFAGRFARLGPSIKKSNRSYRLRSFLSLGAIRPPAPSSMKLMVEGSGASLLFGVCER